MIRRLIEIAKSRPQLLAVLGVALTSVGAALVQKYAAAAGDTIVDMHRQADELDGAIGQRELRLAELRTQCAEQRAILHKLKAGADPSYPTHADLPVDAGEPA